MTKYTKIIVRFMLLILMLVMASPTPGGFILPATVAQASGPYYIATNGSDSNSGTINSPFKTLAKALSVMSGGDTVYFRGGTYSGAGYSVGNGRVIPNGTSWNNATTISAYKNSNNQYETVVLQPSCENIGNGYFCSFGFTSGTDQYIIIQHMVLDGTDARGEGIYFRGGSHDIRIQNMEIRGFTVSADGSEVKNGILMGSRYNGAQAHHIELLNNNIHDNGGYYPSRGETSGMGIYFVANDSIVDGNDLHDNGGTGIQIQDADDYEGAYRNIIRNNRIYNNKNFGGIGSVDGQDNQIYNNLIYNNAGDGIVITPIGGGQPSADRNLIYNNTIYGNHDNCIGVGYFGTAVGNRIYNNICYANGDNNITQTGAASNTSAFSNLLGINPNFVSSSDFHLTQNSYAALNQGTPLGSPWNVDIDGAARPAGSGYDIGAYEFGGSVTPPPPPPPPPPSGIPNKIPQGQMKFASATSNSGEGDLVFDGDIDSRWLAGPLPSEVVLYMNGSYNINAAQYTSNGWTGINNYELYVSADGTNWGSVVASGPMPSDGTITFNGKYGRYVKLKAVSSTTGGSYAYTAEVNVGGLTLQAIVGDINLDRIINSIDYSLLNAKWFSADFAADLNSDGLVNSLDYSMLNTNWFKTW